jgi:hypothetical protein
MFVQNPTGGYDIQIEYGYGDAASRIECAFLHLPDDVEMKFGVGTIMAFPPH